MQLAVSDPLKYSPPRQFRVTVSGSGSEDVERRQRAAAFSL